MLNNKESLNKFLSVKKVYINEETQICIRRWTAAERSEFYKLAKEQNDLEMFDFMVRIAAWVVIKSVCDEKGINIYTMDDGEEVENLDGELLDIIYEASMIYNKMKEDSIKETVKNSEPIQN